MIDLEQVLVFKIDKKLYGISSSVVIQILRVPQLTEVPYLHSAIRGVAPIEGNIVALLDFRVLLKIKNRIDLSSDKCRIVTLRVDDVLYAFIVEEVLNSINIDSKRVEMSDKESDVVMALYKIDNEIIQIVSIDNIFSKIESISLEREDVDDRVSKDLVAEVSEDLIQYLFFKIGDDSFAISSSMVLEIITLSKTITEVANSPIYIEGLLNIRDEVVAIANLSKIYDIKERRSSSSRVIILTHDGKKVGVLVDMILDIKNIDKNSIKRMPERFLQSRFLGVLKDRSSLISVIDDKFIYDLIDELSKFEDGESVESGDLVDEDEVEIVTFKIGEEDYCFFIDDIEEIIKYEKSTPMPFMPELFLGVINLRGAITPIISLHQRLGAIESFSEDKKILVCKNRKNEPLGFLVDMVNEVTFVKKSAFLDSNRDDNIIDNIILKDDKLFLKLNLSNIISLSGVREFKAIS